MKITLIFTFSFFFLSVTGESMGNQAGLVSANVKQWADQHFSKGKIPPFSFVYGGNSSNQFIRNWAFSTK
jgi:alpha-galactosidase